MSKSLLKIKFEWWRFFRRRSRLRHHSNLIFNRLFDINEEILCAKFGLLKSISTGDTKILSFLNRGFGGLSLASLAILLAIYYFYLYLSGGIGLSGYASIAVFITFFSGIIMASISVVGLYIMRLIQQTTFSPHYSLRDYLPRND